MLDIISDRLIFFRTGTRLFRERKEGMHAAIRYMPGSSAEVIATNMQLYSGSIATSVTKSEAMRVMLAIRPL